MEHIKNPLVQAPTPVAQPSASLVQPGVVRVSRIESRVDATNSDEIDDIMGAFNKRSNVQFGEGSDAPLSGEGSEGSDVPE